MSPWPALVSLIALLLYFVITINVGRSRVKHSILVPQMTGHPEFERVVRVQQNTLEQLILFLPALWIFCFYVDPRWGSALGALWVVGRILYAWGYYQAAQKRAPGFIIASLSSLALVLSGLVGVISALLST